MKKIGISFTTTNFKYYRDWFTTNDLADDISIVELSFVRGNDIDIFGCDGFILTGGVDTDPVLYGGSQEYENRPASWQIERDYFESKIYRYAKSQALPVLAICRGMQLVNILEGGGMIQDLAQQNEIHRKDGDIDKLHSVVAEKDTLLYEITGSEKGMVNSAHHQAIDKQYIAPTLQINALSQDGIAEGIEYLDKDIHAFFLGVQWHPERMSEKEHSPFSQNIRKHFIDLVRNSSRNKLTVVNPATEMTIAQIAEDDSITTKRKYALLRNGQVEWNSRPLGDRVAMISRFFELLDSEKDKLALTLTMETGKPLKEAHNELRGARGRIKYFIDNAERYLADEWISADAATREMVSYEPLGVIANISAWNYPYLVGVNVFIPALLGGNSVFYKPSEYATLTGLHICDLLYRSGIPEHSFQIAIGAAATGQMLLDLPLNGYFFTGSYRTGQHISSSAGSKLIACQLELGGKDPLYVMDDIDDIDNVAASVLEGVVYNNGQSCCAVERIYVHEKIYDQFVERYVEKAKSLVVGDPLDPATEIGPLSRKQQIAFLLDQISDAKQKGAKLLAGGDTVDGPGYFLSPAVLINVNHEMRIMKEESFGPIVGIQKVHDDEEAIKLMQDTEYGLTAAIFSKDYKRAEKIMKRLNTGTVYWNCCDRVSATLPWSGRKHSGLGTTLSYQGIRAFVQPKAYHLRGGGN